MLTLNYPLSRASLRPDMRAFAKKDPFLVGGLALGTKRGLCTEIAARLRCLAQLPDCKSKSVLLRIDANVVLEDGAEGLHRLEGTVGSLLQLTVRGARRFLVGAHLKSGLPEETLAPVVPLLQKIYDRVAPGRFQVCFQKDYLGEEGRASVEKTFGELARMYPSRIPVLLLENLRHHKGEKAGSPIFAEELEKLADVYINDAFGALHRPDDASMLPTAAAFIRAGKPTAIGNLILSEVGRVEQILFHGPKPWLVVLSGSKPETKVPILGALAGCAPRESTFIVGGQTGMAMLLATGENLGGQVFSKEVMGLVKKCMKTITDSGIRLQLPEDFDYIGASQDPYRSCEVISDIQVGRKVATSLLPVNIGRVTTRRFCEIIGNYDGSGGTIVANGVMGITENPALRHASKEVFQAIARLTRGRSSSKPPICCLIGGGDSGAFALCHGEIEEALVSTGGGALLECLQKSPAQTKFLKFFA